MKFISELAVAFVDATGLDKNVAYRFNGVQGAVDLDGGSCPLSFRLHCQSTSDSAVLTTTWLTTSRSLLVKDSSTTLQTPVHRSLLQSNFSTTRHLLSFSPKRRAGTRLQLHYCSQRFNAQVFDKRDGQSDFVGQIRALIDGHWRGLYNLRC